MRGSIVIKDAPIEFKHMIDKALPRIMASEPGSYVFHTDAIRKGTNDTGSTYHPYSVMDLRNDEHIEPKNMRASRLTVSRLKWTTGIVVASVIALLIGYLSASRWYDNRVVNPYGMGGYGI